MKVIGFMCIGWERAEKLEKLYGDSGHDSGKVEGPSIG
jgi:hypothetical protein